MSDALLLFVVGLLLFGGIFIAVVSMTQPAKDSRQLHNAYWPYSVETSIKDR